MTLVEMLTGKEPFSTYVWQTVLLQLGKETLQVDGLICADYSREIQQFLRECFQW